MGSHPSAPQGVVVADQEEGTEKRRVAYVVCEDEAAPSDGELRDYLAGRLPDYMMPSRDVRLGQMPLTPSGKVDRGALPAPGGAVVGRQYVAPIGETETKLTRIWAEA